MLFYPAALPLSAQTLTYVAGIIRRHRRKTGSRWRKLNPGRQALLVLAYLRKGETFAGLAAGFGIGTATAWRYVTETVALLAARSPNLRRALTGAKQAGHAYVVIDGTLIPINRVAADRPFYSGKHRRDGMNLQVISAPDGEILWVSGPLPGAMHDLTAARIWGIMAELAATGLIVLADKGYIGAGEHMHTPYRAGTGPPRRKPPTAPTPSYAPANAPRRKPGTSCASSAAAHGAPGSWPRPSTSFRPARSQDEKGSVPAPPERLAGELSTTLWVAPSLNSGVYPFLFPRHSSRSFPDENPIGCRTIPARASSPSSWPPVRAQIVLCERTSRFLPDGAHSTICRNLLRRP